MKNSWTSYTEAPYNFRQLVAKHLAMAADAVGNRAEKRGIATKSKSSMSFHSTPTLICHGPISGRNGATSNECV